MSSDNLDHVNFLKGCFITPSEVAWATSMSNSTAVLVHARRIAENAERWEPMFPIQEVDSILLQARKQSIEAELQQTDIDCQNLIVSKKQRGINSAMEFVAHDDFQPKHTGVSSQALASPRTQTHAAKLLLIPSFIYSLSLPLSI